MSPAWAGEKEGGVVEEVHIGEVSYHRSIVERSTPIRPAPLVDLGEAGRIREVRQVFRPRAASVMIESFELRDIMFDPVRAMLATPDGRLVRNTRYLVPDRDYYNYELSIGDLRMAPGNALLVVGYNRSFRNYYHWIAQCLPAIQFGIGSAPRGKILVTPPLSQMQQQSLALLGLDTVDRMEVSFTVKYFCTRALYSTFLNGISGHEVSFAADHTRQCLKAAVSLSRRGRRRLYVARTDTPNRPLRNQEEVAALLRTRGFDVIRPGDYSLREQIVLFDSASVVVGVHGAGMTNIGFCRAGTKVLEIVPRTYLNACMAVMAQTHGMDYALELCEAEEAEDPHTAHSVIDLDSLRRRVDALIEHTPPISLARRPSEAEDRFDTPPLHGLGQRPHLAAPDTPDITMLGTTSHSPLARPVVMAYDVARLNSGSLPLAIRVMPGRVGRALRIFLNSLTRHVPQPRYLELGASGGDTVCAIIQGQSDAVTVVDSWDESEGEDWRLSSLVARHLPDTVPLQVINAEPAEAAFETIGMHNIVLLNRPTAAGQLRARIGPMLAALERHFVMIVDAWNLAHVRDEVLQMLGELPVTGHLAIEVRTTIDDTAAVRGTGVDHWGDGFLILVASNESRTQPS